MVEGCRLKIFQHSTLNVQPKLRRGGNNLFGRLMIRLVGAIQSQQFLVFLKQILFACRRSQRAGFLRHRNRIVISSRLGAGGRQGANEGGHTIVRQFAGASGIFNGFGAQGNPLKRVLSS